eukprot:g8129.t1
MLEPKQFGGYPYPVTHGDTHTAGAAVPEYFGNSYVPGGERAREKDFSEGVGSMAILAAPVRRITGDRVANRGVNYPLLGLAFIGLAVAKLLTVYWEMEQRVPKSPFGCEGCTRYRDMMSPEDIVPVFEGVFVSSSDERRQAMMQSIGAEASPWGDIFAIWNVDTPGQDPKTALLELEGFPEGTAFHPHGMHYRQETGELFVINHAYSQGGERIDVFKVTANFPQEALPSVHPDLLEVTPPPLPLEEEDRPSVPGQGEKAPPTLKVVDIGVAHAVLGNQDDDDGDGEDGAGGGAEADGGDSSGAGAAAGESGAVEAGGAGGPLSEGDGVAVAGAGADTDGVKVSAETDDAQVEVAAEEEEKEKEQEKEEVVEEVVETPKEIAKRLKREAKEAAAKAKADERKRLADEKAAGKAAAVAKAARAKGLARGVSPIKLTYSFSVEHEFITTNYGVLNDLVLVDDDELYVTQFLAWSHPLHGPTMPDSVVEYLRLYGSILLLALQMSPAPIIRCTGIRGADIDCQKLAKGRGAMYNGIALSPNGERLLVSDTMAMQMVIFDRSLETGALTLRQRLDLPGSPDNLELDLYRASEGTEAYTVGLIRGSDYFKYCGAMDGATSPSDGDDFKMAGGLASVVYNNDQGKYESSLEMWQDGSLLSISSAASTASGARLMGSAVEEGFLLCRPPPCPAGDGEPEASGVCPWGPPPSLEESETEDGAEVGAG